MGDVDSLMAELGLGAPAGAGAAAAPAEPVSEVDALMQELVGAPAPAPTPAPVAAPVSSGPGPAASGPGAAWAAKHAAQAGGTPGAASKPLGVVQEVQPTGASELAKFPIAEPGKGRVLGPGGILVATQTPDGREIRWEGPTCTRCNNGVAGQVLTANGKSYHPECFVCTTCQRPFPGGAFTEHEGKPYCDADYQALFCPTCHNCKQPITAQCASAGEGEKTRRFHPEHFMCTGCGKNLLKIRYRMWEDEVYCMECASKNQARAETPKATCAKCKELIYGDFIMFRGNPVHAEHFACEECGCDFKANDAREWEDGLFCLTCYQRLLLQKCASCNKPIKGRSITALGKMWHPEHFVCSVCHDPLSTGSYFEQDGKPYCEQHFVQEFGERCAKCNNPVLKDVITFGTKSFHREHFQCSGCEKNLDGKKAFNWEQKPLCSKCFDKLPEPVRKRIKKTEKEKQKAAKARAKAAKKGGQ